MTATDMRLANRSAEGEKRVNAICTLGSRSRNASITARACRPSPTDGAWNQTGGRPASRCSLPYRASFSCADLRPATPCASLEEPRLTSGLTTRAKLINTLYAASVTLMLGG